jgi:alpha-beta hydrolase superfamily lysophospholipase
MWGLEPVRLRTMDDIVLSAFYYGSVSDGPSYVLGHGFTGSASQPRVAGIAEHLNGRGAAVLALDFRGHGQSGGLSTVGSKPPMSRPAFNGCVRGARRRP